jgi:type I restriction enzyme S subunit
MSSRSIVTGLPLHSGFSINDIKVSIGIDAIFVKVDDFNDPRNNSGISHSNISFTCPSRMRHRLLGMDTLIFPKRGAAIFINRAEILNCLATLDPNIMGMRALPELTIEYLRHVLLFRDLGRICDNSGIPQINNKHLYPLYFAVPSRDEQNQLNALARDSEGFLRQLRGSLNKLRSLKIGLMQDLLTGKKRVTPLLNQEVAG